MILCVVIKKRYFAIIINFKYIIISPPHPHQENNYLRPNEEDSSTFTSFPPF